MTPDRVEELRDEACANYDDLRDGRVRAAARISVTTEESNE